MGADSSGEELHWCSRDGIPVLKVVSLQSLETAQIPRTYSSEQPPSFGYTSPGGLLGLETTSIQLPALDPKA